MKQVAVKKWNHKVITTPGIYSKMPLDTYHLPDICAGPSASSSMLRKIFIQSPAHFYAQWPGNPNYKPPAEKAHFTLGRAAHHLLLGEDEFAVQFVMRPLKYDSWRTDAAKNWRKVMEESGKTVLLPDDLERIKGMAKALGEHPWIKEDRMLGGSIEHSMFWIDRKTGLWLKSRPDAAPNWNGEFVDLKSCRDIKMIDNDVWTYRYDMQAALQRVGTRELFGIEMETFYFVFVEHEPPHCVDIISIDEEAITEAEKDLRSAIDTFAYCLRTNNWFGPRGTQYDARYAHVPQDKSYKRVEAQAKRDMLMQEINAP